jgi:hypothetical protein
MVLGENGAEWRGYSLVLSVKLPLLCHHLYFQPGPIPQLYPPMSHISPSNWSYVSDHIREHKDDYIPFLDMDLDVYHEELERGTAWGGRVKILALTRVLGGILRYRRLMVLWLLGRMEGSALIILGLVNITIHFAS